MKPVLHIRKPTPAIKQAAEFCVKAQAIKASWEIPVDCKLPSTVAEIEAGRTPRLRQTEMFDDSVMSRLRAVKSMESK